VEAIVSIPSQRVVQHARQDVYVHGHNLVVVVKYEGRSPYGDSQRYRSTCTDEAELEEYHRPHEQDVDHAAADHKIAEVEHEVLPTEAAEVEVSRDEQQGHDDAVPIRRLWHEAIQHC
jgi:hypothetical protein